MARTANILPINLTTVTLLNELAQAALTMTLKAGDGAKLADILITNPAHLVIDSEVIGCDSRSTDVITIRRGLEGTSDVLHTALSIGTVAPVAGQLIQLQGWAEDLEHVLSVLMDGASDGVMRTEGELAVTEQGPPTLSVDVAAGMGWEDRTYFRQTAATTLGPMVAPVTNPRHDLIIFTPRGSLSILTGAEAGSPSDPAVPAGSLKIFRISHRVGETSIKDVDDASNGFIVDLRVFV